MSIEVEQEMRQQIALLELTNVTLLEGLKQSLKVMSTVTDLIPTPEEWHIMLEQFEGTIHIAETMNKIRISAK